MEQQTAGQEGMAPVEGQAQVESPAQEGQIAPEQFLEQTKFKSFDDAVKSFKEAQATITKLSQKSKELEAALQANFSQGAVAPPVAPPPRGQAQPEPDFFEDPVSASRAIARQEALRIARGEVSEAFKNFQASQHIETVRNENPELFDKLKPIAAEIYKEKPFLNNMGIQGLRQALAEAQERRVQAIATLRDEILGNQEANQQTNTNLSEKDKMRAEILAEMERAQGATIPQTGGGRAVTADVRKKVMAARDKGDPDGVLDAIFPSR